MSREGVVAAYTGPAKILCRAHRRDGSPCKNYAIKGASVCRMHGGSAGQVRRKAQRRLEAASDRLAGALLDIATSAESESVRLAAIRDALDRVGLSAKNAEPDPTPPPWMVLLQGITVTGVEPEPAADKLVAGEFVEPPARRSRLQADDEAPPRYADPGRSRPARFDR